VVVVVVVVEVEVKEEEKEVVVEVLMLTTYTAVFHLAACAGIDFPNESKRLASLDTDVEHSKLSRALLQDSILTSE
jgi:hypothetical protein